MLINENLVIEQIEGSEEGYQSAVCHKEQRILDGKTGLQADIFITLRDELYFVVTIYF